MPRRLTSLARRRSVAVTSTLIATVITSLISPTAFALILGGEGNKPLSDPGWPKGAAAIFNTKSRIAWWEGPPFGGGQWHSECRGDAKALSEILAGFATLELKNKRVILHDGVGASFWLNMNNQPAKVADAKMDWILMVWQPRKWELSPTIGSAKSLAGKNTAVSYRAPGRYLAASPMTRASRSRA